MAAKLMIELLGEATSAVSAFKKTEQAAQTTTGAAGKTGLSLAGIAKGVAAGFAVKKVIDFGKSTVDAAGEAAHANKLLTAVFKDTGDATGEAAKHAVDLAESMGRQTGIQPTVIKNAEAILATFHSVSGETGRQAGLFDRATAAAADLAAAGFGDMSTNAKQLGRALEDPAKGVAALARSGVTFTAAQKAQIAQMQKSGDLLGAQKVVLAAVEGQVKGTAAATAGSSAKMKVAYEQLQVAIGNQLLPVISKFRTELTGLINFASANASWLVPLITAIVTFAVAAVTVSKAITLVSTSIRVFTMAVQVAKTVWLLLNVAFAASPIGVIIVAIVALVAIIILIATKTTWFQSIWRAMTAFLVAAWNATVGAVVSAWNHVYAVLAAGFNAVRSIVASVLNWIRGNWPLLIGILAGPFGIAVAMVIRYWSPISSFFSGVVSAIGGAFSRVIGVITQPFITAFNIVRGAVDAVVGHIQQVVGGVLSFVNGAIATAKGVYNAFARTWNGIQVSMPSVDTHIPGIGKVGGFTVGLPDLPILAAGGLITRTGLIYAHAGEAITPAPRRLGGDGPVVRIEHAHFSERVDVDAFSKRLAWTLQTAAV